MSKARDLADFVSVGNIDDIGTEGTKVASGTSAQRGSTTGQFRFNSTTGLAEYYDGTQFKSIDAPPTIQSLDVTEVDSQAGGNQTIVITGGNFASGATVSFIGAVGTNFNASTVTVDSISQITVVAPKASFLNAQEPYGVKVENVSGLSATLANQINVDTSPSWSTASGTIATVTDDATGTHATVSATDSDGDTIAYSVQSGSIPAGTSLDASTGAISGDPTNVNASTTNTFTLRATANNKTVDRSFNIIVNPTLDGSNSSRAAPSATHIRRLGITENNFYWISTANGVTQKVPMILETGLSGSTTSTARGYIIAANNSESSGNLVRTNHQPRLTATPGYVGYNGNATNGLPTNGDWSAVVSDQTNFSINMRDIGFDEMIFMAHGTGGGDTGNWETSFGSSPSSTFVSTNIVKAFWAAEFTQNIKIPTTTTWQVNPSQSVNFGSNSATSSPENYWSRSGYVPTGMPSRRLRDENLGKYTMDSGFGIMNDVNGSAPTIQGSGATTQSYPLWICAAGTTATTNITSTFSWSDSSNNPSGVGYGWDDFQDGSGMGDQWSVDGQGSNAFKGHPACILVRA